MNYSKPGEGFYFGQPTESPLSQNSSFDCRVRAERLTQLLFPTKEMDSQGNLNVYFNGVSGSISKGVRFDWTIPSYFSFAAGTKGYISSPAFTFAGCFWCLRVYPTGVNEPTEDNNHSVSLYLYKEDSDTDVRTITFTLGIKKLHGQLEKEQSFTRPFSKSHLGWGLTKLCHGDDIMKRKSELGTWNEVTFTCFIEDCASYPVEVTPQLTKLVKLETLSTNFNDLFISKSKCDVTIRVKDKEFLAHKTILMARSSVFASMFEHEMSEKETGVITIEDSDPDTFGDFLQYLYSGTAEELSFRKGYHLYITADKYEVTELKSFCAACMIRNLTTENVCDAIIIADQYGDTRLFSAVQNFFNRNIKEILSTSEWEKLLKEYPHLGNKLFKGMVSKMEIQE